MKKLNKIVTVLVIGGTLISSSAVAMASTSTAASGNSLNNRTAIAGKGFKSGTGQGSIYSSESNLKVLVTAGILTQAEADKILELSKTQDAARQAEMDKVKNMTAEERKTYFESLKGQTTQSKNDIFTLAVSKGIITQAKADAAKAKFQETRDTERTTKLTEGLKELVTAGTITQEQADKVLAYINTLEASKPAKDTTSTEDKSSTSSKNLLSALVDNGTLTQAQLDAVTKALPFGGDRGHGFNGGKGMGR